MTEWSPPEPGAVAQAEAEWRGRPAASAEIYERAAVPSVFRPWAGRLLDRLAPASGARVLDLACGTGIVARLAAARIRPGGRVVGLDISPGMLAVARAQPVPDGACVDWQVGSAAALPYRDAAFDLAACQFGLMFFPDRAGALAELRRVLVPGGRLGVSVWSTEAENPVDARIIAVQARYAGAGASARQAVSHALGDPNKLRQLLAEAGFESVEVETLADEYRLAIERLLGRVLTPQADEATRAAVLRDLRVALDPYLDGDEVRCPVTAHLAIAVA